MTVTWRVRVSWDNSLDFVGTYDNITAFVREDSVTRIQRGFARGGGFDSELARIATIGTAYLTLDNSDQRFTPNNTGSPLYGNLLPMRQIIIDASPDAFASVTWPLFRGYIRRIRLDADLRGERLAYLECEDMLAKLARQRFAQPLQENRTADQLYSLVLSATFRGEAANGLIYPNATAPPYSPIQPDDGDTATVGERTYTFKTAIGAAYDVLIGDSVVETYNYLAAAINAGDYNGDEAGTIYGTNTLKSYEASALYSDVIGPIQCQLTALYRGTVGNSITLSSTGQVLVGAAAFENGTDEPSGLTSHETGKRTYTIAMDRWSLDSTNAGQAMEDVARSEFGWVWISGNGTLTTKSYHWEQLQTAAAADLTLDNTHARMDADISDELLANKIEVINTPRRETAGVTIAQSSNIIAVPGKTTDARWNQVKGLSGAAALNALPPGSLTLRLPFVDSGTGQVTGAKDLIVPVRGTDYSIYENADGSGFDYTTNPINRVTCSVVVTGSGVEVTFSNTAIATLYVANFKVRGTRIEQYDPQSILREDFDSIDAYGERTLVYDLPLDAGDNFPTALANQLLGRYKTPVQRTGPIVIEDGLTPIGGVYPIAMDIGNRVDIQEDQTVTDQKALIRAIDYDIAYNQVQMTIHTKTLTDQTYWILGDATYGVLGTTTRLGL